MKVLLYRIGFFVPVMLFLVFILLIVVGIIAQFMHSGPSFYCGVYCKLAAAMIFISVPGTVYWQTKMGK